MVPLRSLRDKCLPMNICRVCEFQRVVVFEKSGRAGEISCDL